MKKIKIRIDNGRNILIAERQDMLDKGLVKNRAELARRVVVTRARVIQVLGSEKTI
jgi:hypothetical protein